MPRGPRLDHPGALHHVIARGIERRDIFYSDVDRRDLLDRLAQLAPAMDTPIYAWCLMSNHVHLLVRSGVAGLSAFAQRLLGGYASAFNRRHRRSGYLFQNRFKSTLVEPEPYFLELVRYIHSNPLRAGILPDLDALDRYPWSGHAVLLGHLAGPWQATDPVLACFSSRAGGARRAYRAFVQDGLERHTIPDLSGGGLRRSAGGWDRLLGVRRGREAWAFDERVLGSSAFVHDVLADAPPVPIAPIGRRDTSQLDHLLTELAARHGVPRSDIAGPSKRSAATTARADFCDRAHADYGWTFAAIARYLGISRPSVARALHRQSLAPNIAERERRTA
jgi:REP element-mobilizing transposase RayT